MQLNDLKIFCETLNQTIEKSNYISQNDSGKFCIIKEKANKNLKTQDIAKWAELYFNQLSENTTLSVQEKKQQENDLARSLKVYSTRVYQSKFWYEKIINFFGFKSDAEQRISHVVNDLFSEILQQEKVNADIESAKTRNSIILKFLSLLPIPKLNKDLKLFYHKTAENSQRIKHLDGMLFYESIDSIIDDLNHWEDPSLANTIKQLIDEFTFARAINLLQKENYNEDLLSLGILEKLQQMSTSTNDKKSFMILPGGHKGHAALYIINKQEDCTYSFKVINTGSGCSILTTSPTIDKQGIIHIPNQVAKDDRLLVVSYQYTHLTEKQLSKEFFKTLLFLSKTSPTMTEVNEFINRQLQHDSNLEQDAAHEKQGHGTCTMRCLLAFLSIELDVMAYQKFYKFILDREINRFDKSKMIQMIAKIDPRVFQLRENAVKQI